MTRIEFAAHLLIMVVGSSSLFFVADWLRYGGM